MPSQLKIRLWNAKELPRDWFKRAQALDESIENDVKAVISEVKKNGDVAVAKFTEKYDKVKIDLDNFRVPPQEIQAAYSKVTKEQINALKLMKQKVGSLEKLTVKDLEILSSSEGVTVRSVVFPVESVGCYVPGGQAAYPSTVVMTTVPAKIAGVPRIVVCSPPDKDGNVNPLVVVAADICEVNEIYKVGGVQAIAALAYGTATIKPVRKIVGPGSKYVTMAKVLVS